MVTKNRTSEKKGKVNVGKLKVNKETVRNLTGDEKKRVKGGIVGKPNAAVSYGGGCSLGIVHLPQLLPQRTGDGGQ